MFSWRLRRQLTAFIIIACGAGGAAFLLVSKILPAPSCFDSKKNQGELGVDCGGPCGVCELKNPKPMTIFWARAGHAGPGVFDAVAYVENPNEILSSARLEYEFAFFDSVGEISRRRGTTFVFAQERIHIVEPAIQLLRDPTRVEFRVLGAAWQALSAPPADMIVESRSYGVRDIGSKKHSVVEAVVLNASAFDFRRVETAVVVFDAEGNVIGANRVENEDSRAGQKMTVVSLWPVELSGGVTTIDVRPRVNMFSPDAIVKP